MKIKLTTEWVDYGEVYPAGTIVDVSDRDGALLVAAGHIEVNPDTRSTRGQLYNIGCAPNPFNTVTETFKTETKK